MPVLGHAVVGIVAAQLVGREGVRSPFRPPVYDSAFWMPLLVLLSYLPDMATQVGSWIDYAAAREAGHSVPLGALVGVLIGLVWARGSGGSVRVLVAVAVGMILSHDLLDLLQDDGRAPFWPFSSTLLGVSWIPLRDRLSNELLIFVGPYAVFQAVVSFVRLRSGVRPAIGGRQRWASRALIVVMLAAVASGLWLRGERQRRLRAAERLLRAGQYAEALRAAEAADRWFLSGRSVRLELLEGRAFEALGDRQAAERCYVAAFRRDPHDFWAVASLAEFYASAEDVHDDRARSKPYVELLRRQFHTHSAFERVMKRIDAAPEE